MLGPTQQINTVRPIKTEIKDRAPSVSKRSRDHTNARYHRTVQRCTKSARVLRHSIALEMIINADSVFSGLINF